MPTSERTSAPVELDSSLKKWLFRIAVIAPFAIAMFSYVYCTSYELACQTQHEKAQERNAKTSDSDGLPVPLGIEAKIYESTTGEEADNSNTCSFFCDVFKRAREDAVAFFTAVLACIVWLQFLFMIRQEDWLRRGWKAAAAANGIALRAEKRAQETARTIERAYVQMSHVTPADIQNESALEVGHTGICRVTLEIKNYGNTPARLTRIYMNHAVFQSNTELPDGPDYSRKQPGEFPVEAFLVKGGYVQIFHPFQITADEVEPLTQGSRVLLIYGYVEYMDQFHRSYRGGYARTLRPGVSGNNLVFVPKPKYNYDEQRG